MGCPSEDARSAGFKLMCNMCNMRQIAWGCHIQAYALHASKCIELLYQRPRSGILIRNAPSKLTRRTSEDALKRQSPTCVWHTLHQTVLECRIQAYALHASKCSELLYPKPFSAGSTLSTSQPVPWVSTARAPSCLTSEVKRGRVY